MPQRIHTREAKKFLDLNWEQKIYKDPNLKYNDLAPMLGFDRYRPSLRMCKKHFGMTISIFFKHCKVLDIKHFLAQPESRDYELLEIALKFGHKSRRFFNKSFKDITGITPREFWFFHEHFVETTGMTLAEYEQPEVEQYVPSDGKPTFLSNFLNTQAGKINKS